MKIVPAGASNQKRNIKLRSASPSGVLLSWDEADGFHEFFYFWKTKTSNHFVNERLIDENLAR